MQIQSHMLTVFYVLGLVQWQVHCYGLCTDIEDDHIIIFCTVEEWTCNVAIKMIIATELGIPIECFDRSKGPIELDIVALELHLLLPKH